MQTAKQAIFHHRLNLLLNASLLNCQKAGRHLLRYNLSPISGEEKLNCLLAFWMLPLISLKP